MTDAHLIALALHRSARVATLDGGLTRLVLPPTDATTCVTLVR